MEERLSAIQSEAAKDKQTVSRLHEIRAVLGQELILFFNKNKIKSKSEQ